MAKRSPSAEPAEVGKDAKVVIYCRIDPNTVSGLDAIAEGMRPQPTRAQLIDVACAEYVERHGPASKRGKGATS